MAGNQHPLARQLWDWQLTISSAAEANGVFGTTARTRTFTKQRKPHSKPPLVQRRWRYDKATKYGLLHRRARLQPAQQMSDSPLPMFQPEETTNGRLFV